MREAVIEIESSKTGEVHPAVYEHPWAVRFCHWLNAVSLLVMVASGLSDLPRLSQLRRENSAEGSVALAAGVRPGRLAGRRPAVAPHLHVDLHRDRAFSTWDIRFSAGTIARCCLCRETFAGSGRWCSYYFFFGPKPLARETYNPLQKLAYTSAVGLGVLSVLTGLAVWKPVQFSWLAWMMGGFHLARHLAFCWSCGRFCSSCSDTWSWSFSTAGTISCRC